MTKLANVLIYHWEGWKGFLISHLVADYCHLEAKINDTIADLEPSLTPDIQAVLLQINLTHAEQFPTQRQQLIKDLQAKGLLVLNHNIADISKSNLHRMLEDAGLESAKASPEGEPNEMLFIKSDLNWGGELERRQSAELQQMLDIDPQAPIKTHSQYYRAQRKTLSADIWQNRSVTIERFIDNPDESFYRVYAFGDAIVVVKAHAPELIKKINGDARDYNYFYQREGIMKGKTDLPPKLQTTIRKFMQYEQFQHSGLSYFCLDIVHDLNDFYIIDLNLTPYAGMDEQTTAATEFLCQGAQHYLRRKLKKQA